MSDAWVCGFALRLAPVWLLVVCSPYVSVAEEPSILYLHGEAIAKLHDRKSAPARIRLSEDVALGTQAAWTPAHDSLLFATNGRNKRLILRTWRDGEERDQVLPLPPVETDLELQWQWSFSPDGRWLAVRRRASPDYDWRYSGADAVRQEAERVKWLGVVELRTLEAHAWKRWGAILGWRNGSCVLCDGGYRPIFAVDPAKPEKSEELLQNGGALAGFSPDGKRAVIWDGTEGNVRVTLQELGGSPPRVLLDEPLPRNGGHRKVASAQGTFSPDSALVAFATLLRNEGGWTTSVAIETLDGKTRLYEDSFDIDSESDMARTVSSPAPPNRFAYFRFRRGQNGGELVVVELKAGKASASSIALKVKPADLLRFPPVWSPAGDRVAWLVGDRTVVIGDLKTYGASIGGRLPDDAASWSWASPRVGGAATQD